MNRELAGLLEGINSAIDEGAWRRATRASDRAFNKVHHAANRVMHHVAKRGGRAGKVASSLYHQAMAASMVGHSLHKRITGHKNAAKRDMRSAAQHAKTGIRHGLRVAAPALRRK